MAQKILVVDDEESLAQFVCRALRQQGYKTVCAYDGDNALSLVYEEMPDLVILDLMLPLMDGWEICRRVKSDEETRHIPILMLTARSSAEDVVQGLDLGADDYMRKPFPLDELLARVRVLLRRSQGPADTKKVIEDRDFKLDTAEKEVWLRGSIDPSVDMGARELRHAHGRRTHVAPPQEARRRKEAHALRADAARARLQADMGGGGIGCRRFVRSQ